MPMRDDAIGDVEEERALEGRDPELAWRARLPGVLVDHGPRPEDLGPGEAGLGREAAPDRDGAHRGTRSAPQTPAESAGDIGRASAQAVGDRAQRHGSSTKERVSLRLPILPSPSS